jgi:hypothetical protein
MACFAAATREGAKLVIPAGQLIHSTVFRTASSIADRMDDVHNTIRTAGVFAFDVDSTVLNGEGIDTLAEFAGKGQEVAEWTQRCVNQ